MMLRRILTELNSLVPSVEEYMATGENREQCQAINNTDAEVVSCISQGPYKRYINDSITNHSD